MQSRRTPPKVEKVLREGRRKSEAFSRRGVSDKALWGCLLERHGKGTSSAGAKEWHGGGKARASFRKRLRPPGLKG